MAHESSSHGIVEKTMKIAEPVAKEQGLSIYDIEFIKEAAQWYLRIYIDKDEPVSISDCEFVSRAVEKALDTNDFIEKAYILEVSSPGINRKLKTENDFIRFNGEEVDVKLYKAKDGSKEYQGTLMAYSSGDVTIEIEGKTLVFQENEIASVRLAILF